MSDTLRQEPPAGLRDYLRQVMQERNAPGMQVAVVRDGHVVALEALGLANVEHDVPVTDLSVFSINSMAKAFTGVALMQLVEAGQLDLHASVARYLDELPEHWQPITVLQLATLTSGLPEIMEYTPDASARLIGDGDEQSAWTAAYAAPMEFAPGKGYNYVQTNYALLGKVVASVSGRPFTDYVAERQFRLAGMTHTLYADDRDIIPGRADTYMSLNPEGAPTGRVDRSHINWPPVLRTAVGLHSTAQDLARWLVALQDGSLLAQQSSLRTLWTPVPGDGGRPGLWGVGWLVFPRDVGLVPAPGGGGKAQIAVYPNGLSVILLTNLLGAFPEHVSVVSGRPFDLTFMDGVARFYRPG